MKLLTAIFSAVLLSIPSFAQSIAAYQFSMGIVRYDHSNGTQLSINPGAMSLYVGMTSADSKAGKYYFVQLSTLHDIISSVDIYNPKAIQTDTIYNARFYNLEYSDGKLYGLTNKKFGYFDLSAHTWVDLDTTTFKPETPSKAYSTFDNAGKRLFYCSPGAIITSAPDTICTYNIATKILTKDLLPIGHRGWTEMEYSTKNNKLYAVDISGISSFDPVTKNIVTLSTAILRTSAIKNGISSFDSVNNTYYFAKTAGTSADTLFRYDIDNNLLFKDTIPKNITNIEFMQQPVCMVPDTIYTNISGTSVALSWPAVTGATAYEYYWGTPPMTPPATTSKISSASLLIQGLARGVKYSFCMRSQCSSNNFSPWKCTDITIPILCPAPDTLTATSQTSTTALATWSSVAGASGYEYFSGPSPTTPPGSGIAISQTSLAFNGLYPGTMYDICVRAKCGTEYSNWVCSTFTTPVAIRAINKENTVSIYPNPAGDAINLQFEELADVKAIYLRNVLGQVCRKVSNWRKGDQVDISGMTGGVYQISVVTNDAVYSGSFIKN